MLIIRELRSMFRTVLASDCFVEKNVTSLKRMSVYSFCIAGLTVIRLFLAMTPAAMVEVLVFLIAGLFSRVLAGNLSLLFYICISGGLFRSAAGNGKNNGADGGYPCKYVRNPYAESLVPDAALSQRGRSGRNLSDHLDNYGCLPGRDVLAAE